MPPPPILANMVPAQTDSLLSADANRIRQPLGQDAQAAARAGTRFGPPLVTLPPLGEPLIRLYPLSNISAFARIVHIPLELAEPEPGVHERLGIRNGNAPEPIALIAFRFFDPNTPPKPHNAAWDPGAMKQARDAALVFSRRAAADNRRESAW